MLICQSCQLNLLKLYEQCLLHNAMHKRTGRAWKKLEKINKYIYMYVFVIVPNLNFAVAFHFTFTVTLSQLSRTVEYLYVVCRSWDTVIMLRLFYFCNDSIVILSEVYELQISEHCNEWTETLSNSFRIFFWLSCFFADIRIWFQTGHMKAVAVILKVVIFVKNLHLNSFSSHFTDSSSRLILKQFHQHYVFSPEHPMTFSSLKHSITTHRAPTLILYSWSAATDYQCLIVDYTEESFLLLQAAIWLSLSCLQKG